MRNNGNLQQGSNSEQVENGYIVPGNTKKFLYTGPQRDDQSDDQWIFSPRKTSESPRADGGIDMEDVWSIKKNVSLGGATGSGRNLSGKNDGLNLKANKTYYSRYGGAKVKDEFGSSLAGSTGSRSNPTDSAGNNRSWNYQSKGFSYSSFGGSPDNKNTQGQGSLNSATQQSPQYSSFTSKSNRDSSLW